MIHSRKVFISLLLTLLLASVSVASAQTANYVHVVPKVKQAPQIDGTLTDSAWLEASQKGSKVVVDLHSTATRLTTYPRVAYMAYDDKALYFAFVVYHPDLEQLVTNEARPWEGDEVEIFLKPEGSSGNHQFIISAKNDQAHLTYGTVKASSVAYKSATQISDIKWTLEVAIPFEELGHTPSSGDEWTFNLNGNQYSIGDGYIAWNPTYGSFQNPSRFATLVFE